MTGISVRTGQLSSSAGQLQAVRRGVDQRARGVDGVLHGLDLQISARGHFDARLRLLIGRLDGQALRLADQGRFLNSAAARYDTAETRVCAAVPEGGSRGRSAASLLDRILGNAMQRRELQEALKDLVRGTPLGAYISFAEAMAARDGRGLDWVIGDVARRQFESIESFSEGLDHLDTYFESRGGVWRLGNAAVDLGTAFTPVGLADTVSSVFGDVREGDFAGALWDALPGKDALEGGMHIGDVIAQDLGVADWAADQVPGIDGWAPDLSGLSTPEVLGTVELEFKTGLEAVWDWVTP